MVRAGDAAAELPYHRIEIQDDGAAEAEIETAAGYLHCCLELRERYQAQVRGAARGALGSSTEYAMRDGVVCITGEAFPCKTYAEYLEDWWHVFEAVNNGPANSVCRNRLKILEEKYAIHCVLNGVLEEEQCPVKKGGGIFARCVKVDNSVKLNTAVHPQDVVDFINEAGAAEKRQGKHADVWAGVSNFTVEGLGLHPPAAKCFHRFDVFSPAHNSGGEAPAALLSTFLKRDGDFFHQILRPTLDRAAADFDEKRVGMEYKLQLYGCSREEWGHLATWVRKNGIGGRGNVLFLIQIPRQKAARQRTRYNGTATLQDQLDAIFLPLWKATLHPETPEDDAIAWLLAQVGGFTVEGDEYQRHRPLPPQRAPGDYPWAEDPHDAVFNYYLWANMVALNHARARNGLNTFVFRPHCGEQGRFDALVSAFLLAENILHGALTMGRSQVLQYLFYLSQTGIVFSPLAANGIGKLPYVEHPFLRFQRMGMNVSLGTEDPLHYHHSRDPVLEEYGTAAKLYKLLPVDVTEVARSSVLNSAFPDATKAAWLGLGYAAGAAGNNHDLSFVPDIRLLFREATLSHERQILIDAVTLQHAASFLAPSPRAGASSFPYSLSSPTGLPRRRSSVSTSGKLVSDEGVDFVRIQIKTPTGKAAGLGQHRNDAYAAERLADALSLRVKYIPHTDRAAFVSAATPAKGCGDEFASSTSEYEFVMKGGVFRYKKRARDPAPTRYDDEAADGYEPAGLPSLAEFKKDYLRIHDIVDDEAVKAFAHKRLEVLEHKFSLHMALNHTLEDMKDLAGGESRDFYQASKVDTHIHAAAGMTARQLLHFIQSKAAQSLDDIVEVDRATKTPVTLDTFLQRQQINPEKLTVDLLDVQADASLFERFDNFNNKYNPLGNSELRTLLLKTDNYMGGRYFAEIAKLTFAQYVRDENTYAEMRLSIYGRKPDEWAKLAAWFDTHGMSCSHNKWMVQVPRVYQIFRKLGSVTSFQDVLVNVFRPLWEVSMDPRSDPKLHHFLKHVSGFDSVDNESTPDAPLDVIPPSDWTSHRNPPYGYWMYFMWANIHALNAFRAKKGLSTFAFRPHCGESGSAEHLMHCHLTANQINHGVNLRHDPVLEYLYYLTQVGIAVSPLSNNSLFLSLQDNPFPKFFRRGLNVSLSTDDPLQFHYTQEPLIEEYSVASKTWNFTDNDMCEIARNSVRQSGFDAAKKAELIGAEYLLNSSAGNAESKTHLSDVRVAYRFEAYHNEIEAMETALQAPRFDALRCFASIDEECAWVRERRAARRQAHPEGSAVADSPKAAHDEREGLLEEENARLREEVQRLKEMHSSQGPPRPSAHAAKKLDVNALATVLSTALAPLVDRITSLEERVAHREHAHTDRAPPAAPLNAELKNVADEVMSPLLARLDAIEKNA